MASDERNRMVGELIEREKQGVLSTMSARHEGWPFGSATPYLIGDDGDPIIFISSLAEHTRNLLANPRVSLFIQNSASVNDPVAGSRVTLLCEAEQMPESESERVMAAYLRRFPEATRNFQLGGFSFFRLKIRHIRYIGGFGEMFWL